MTPGMLLVYLGALAVMAEIADRMPAPSDRYRHLADHADLGCGAEEYRGPRRFTRPSEAADTRKAPDDSTAKRTSEAFTTHQLNHQENR